MRVVQQFTFQEIKAFKFGYHPLRKPKLMVNIYFVDGLLIDTGQSLADKDVFAQLKDLPVKQIFITHHHEDHTGNLKRLQNHFNCPVYASEDCCRLMKSPPAISFAQKLIWGDRPAFTNITPVKDSISTPNHTFQLIPVPGHAEDMMVLYEEEKRWLFSADLYVNFYINYMLKAESIATQIASIKKVLLLDFDLLLCAHNPQTTKAKRKLERKLEFLENFQREVLEWKSKGYSAQQIFKKMGLRENWGTRFLSNGALCRMNMVQSVLRDMENRK